MRKSTKCLNETNPDISKYLDDNNDGNNYSIGTTHKLKWRCPYCNNIRIDTPSHIKERGLKCKYCSDGISYPEKVMYNLLKQLNVEFEYQKMFNWSNRKIYDFYLNKFNIIVEINGEQHYTNAFDSMGGLSIKEYQDRDKQKCNLALNNGINNVIFINCSKSNITFIRKSMINSKLSCFLNLENVKWDLIDNEAKKSFLVIACKIKLKNPDFSTSDIGNILKIKRHAIRKFLIKGTELGLCYYNPDLERNLKRKKKVICLSNNKIYDSLMAASKDTENCIGAITNCCDHKTDNTKDGLKWSYV